MATKANKNQVELQNTVNKYIDPLIEPIQKATGIGTWGGYDGAAQYLNSPRFDGLKRQGKDAYDLGLEKCLIAISETSISKSETTVLKNFANEHLDFILQLSKKSPEMFVGENGKIAQACKSVMNESQKKAFEKNLGINKVEKDSLVNKHLGADKVKPTFAERITQSREESLQQPAR
ncbi:hypothetical protein NF27_CG01410 [Candidatus Jidaibacter acanthamoeba]|uniref:Uncharacterized protein n=1 Tax=Candidatus Jidaibacter acanthamoebae TaxID=86105 RepID=A0A0C1N0X2_9RICK|nr:hypothetical protein [Candidatus Jidaibacter acanthamoeba]KIE05961.1 hypothetical protein NF27_CG01410 [Candidatus Jidaibacter acanthamoeba]